MGIHLRVFSESYPMNTNMAGFTWYLKVLVLWTKVALALEVLMMHFLPKPFMENI